MKEEIFNSLNKASLKIFPEFSGNFQVSKPQDSLHGDWTSNLALIMAKQMKRNPRELANEIVEALESPQSFEKIVIAGAGFLNFYLKEEMFFEKTKEFAKGKFETPLEKNPKKILLEYVSSNPTGPIHVGHGRSAAFGSALANLLKKAGNNVTQEYYLNDRGLQAKTLGLSVFLRMQELQGIDVNLPEGCYAGEYVKDLALKAKKKFKKKFLLKGIDTSSLESLDDWFNLIEDSFKDFSDLSNFVIEIQTDQIKKDLKSFNVQYDSWFKESDLF